MKKNEIIQKSSEFSEIINTATKIKNKYLTIFYRKNSTINRYGITVPTKLGNAVIRNKNKRQIKNIIDKNKKNIKKSYDYVIILKSEIINLNYQAKEEELINLITKIGD